MEDDRRSSGGEGQSGRVVEHADRHPELLAAVGVAHEAGQWRMDGEGDARLPCAGARTAFVARPGMVLDPLVPEPDVVGPDLDAVAARIIETDRP